MKTKGNVILKNASELVTCSGFEKKHGKDMSDLHIIKDGAVVIKNGIIEKVGTTEEVLKDFDVSGYEIVDCTGKTIMPGFVDSHTHLVFGGYRDEEFSWRLRGDSYVSIMERGGGIAKTVDCTREASYEELVTLGMKRLNSMAKFGVTTVESKSGYGLDVENELKQLEVTKELNRKHSLDLVSTFMGAHDIPKEYKGRSGDYIDYVIEHMLPVVAEKGLAEYCDIFTEDKVFSIEESRKLLIAAKAHGFKLKMHADEIVRLGGAELAAEVGCTSADHLLQASDEGLIAMGKAGTMCTLLPGTAYSLKADFARGRFMIDNDCAVAIATDFNPGSCFTESIPLVISLATLYMNMSIEETITALTINGAAALDRANEIGSIDVGKAGDIVVHEFPSYHFLTYHIGVSTVEKVIKSGRMIYDTTKNEVQ